MWRGIPLSEGAVLQPSVAVEAGRFSISAWANFVADREENRGRFNEVDLTAERRREGGKIGVRPSLLYISYPNRTDIRDSAEAEVEITYPTGPWEWVTRHDADFARYPGSYYGDFGLSYERELRPKMAGKVLVETGWGSRKFNEIYLGLSKFAWGHVRGELSMTYSPAPSLSVRPHFGISHLLDNDLKRLVDRATVPVGGVALDFTF